MLRPARSLVRRARHPVRRVAVSLTVAVGVAAVTAAVGADLFAPGIPGRLSDTAWVGASAGILCQIALAALALAMPEPVS